MFRLNLTYVFEALEAIERLNAYHPQSNWVYKNAASQIRDIMTNPIFEGHLKASMPKAVELTQLLEKVDSNLEDIDDNPSAFGPIVKRDYTDGVRFGWLKLRNVLLAELAVLPTYFVLPQAAYDTDILIDRGRRLFPENLSEQVSAAIHDADMAGRALIFQLPTACAFHIFRMVETVSNEYIKTIECINKNKKRTLGQLAQELIEKTECDSKVGIPLQQLTQNYRNPTVHQSAETSMDEARAMIGLASSVISPMLTALEKNGMASD